MEKSHISSKRHNLIENANRRRGRGANLNMTGRYEKLSYSDWHDGWNNDELQDVFQTEIQEEVARKIITTNQSPDIAFDQSINPYRGCEHGCSYCFARPTHAYMGLSPGLDFETKLFAKTNCADLLEQELASPKYKPRLIALGTNTDPYQPIEKHYRLTRSILKILDNTHHPVGIVTKSALITRDIDILARMAERRLVKVALSITTLDNHLARQMEPRANAPHKRLAALKQLNEAGIPTMALIAPVIPSLNENEIETIVETLAQIGVREAHYVLLRLPLELKDLFRCWLSENFPHKAARIMSLLRDMRGGKDYDSRWSHRMRGEGPYAAHIAQRFNLALKRHGMNEDKFFLRKDLFTPPILAGQQMSLFQ